MTAIPSKSILDGSATPTTSQFKNAMGQLHDFLNERSGDFLTGVSGDNTIAATAPASVNSYAAGQEFSFVASGSNTGAVTLNINSLGAKAVTKNGNIALETGDITTGKVVKVVYDGTRFQATSIDGVPYATTYVKSDVANNFTSPQRSALLTDNDANFDLSAKQNFKCTTSGSVTLTFSNQQDGLSGSVIFINASNHAVAAHSSTKITASDLSKINATGTYRIDYLSDGTNAYCSVVGPY